MKAKLFQWFSRKGINFFISTVITVLVASAILTFYSRYVIDEQRERSKQAQQVVLDLKQLSSFIIIADVGVRGYMHIQEDRFIAPLHYAKDAYPKTLKSIEAVLISQNYPGIDSMTIVKTDIANYMQMLDNMHQLTKNGQLEEAQAILYKDLGLSLIQSYNQFSAKVNAYEQELLSRANTISTTYINLITYMQWLLLCIGLPTLVMVIVRIKKADSARKQLFVELNESNKKYIFDSLEEEKESNEQNIIENLIKNLQQALQYVKSITAGDYDVSWQGMTASNQTVNKENLAGELIQMRDQMKKVKEEDKRRLWNTEGLSMVAEITRKYQQNTDQLGEQLVIKVVQYLEANQAGLFILNEGDDDQLCLELAACYAYDRKKYLKKSIAPGEGLVGQAYLEAETIYITEIPEDYVRITSGLGKANPRSILIVPLKYNEEVMGVLEIAAFKPFESFQIAFVESLGEIIASSLSTAKTNAKTRALLEQSQENSEELRAQEEEMRQNMEELGATQEEMHRKSMEMENRIQAINASGVASIEFEMDGTIITANEAFLGLMGYTLNEIRGKHHSLFVKSELVTSDEYRQMWDDLRKGKKHDGEFERVTKSGKSVLIKGAYTSMLDIQGKPFRVIKLAMDITKTNKSVVETS